MTEPWGGLCGISGDGTRRGGQRGSGENGWGDVGFLVGGDVLKFFFDFFGCSSNQNKGRVLFGLGWKVVEVVGL